VQIFTHLPLFASPVSKVGWEKNIFARKLHEFHKSGLRPRNGETVAIYQSATEKCGNYSPDVSCGGDMDMPLAF
jgi:hypothetical protein